MSKRILVTGATGKIGGAVAAQLLETSAMSRASIPRTSSPSRAATSGPESHGAATNFMRQVSNFMLTALTPMHRLDKFDRIEQHPRPAHPRFSGRSITERTGTQ